MILIDHMVKGGLFKDWCEMTQLQFSSSQKWEMKWWLPMMGNNACVWQLGTPERGNEVCTFYLFFYWDAVKNNIFVFWAFSILHILCCIDTQICAQIQWIIWWYLCEQNCLRCSQNNCEKATKESLILGASQKYQSQLDTQIEIQIWSKWHNLPPGLL